ncbi:universal stress protein [Haloarchaeobius amylolyticus]|uniref:universal stress protein n=1 Tax=Haloarchaeobius amylolyticus TaxID=1198296 RepID=UPI002270DE60|nr:universal stress protein [Haloarchaeobius amylolyticus]
MSLLVPFDGSDLSTTALRRATEFADFSDASLVVLTLVPDDPEYARERGWLDPEDTFDVGVIERKLRQRVHDIAPNAEFRCELVEENADPVATLPMDVARRIRQIAADVDAEILFVGSENAGRVSTPLTSVGSPISEDPQYDVHIVRHPE